MTSVAIGHAGSLPEGEQLPRSNSADHVVTERNTTLATSMQQCSDSSENANPLSDINDLENISSETDLSEIESDISEVNSNSGFTNYETRNKRKKRKRKERAEMLKNGNMNDMTNSLSEQCSRKNNKQQPRGSDGTVLYFPRNFEGNEFDKATWITEVRDLGHSISALTGKNGLKVLAKTKESLEMLTTRGHKGTLLFCPDGEEKSEKATKVIIFGADPHSMHLEYITNACPNISGLDWNKWSRNKREVIGWYKGPVPKTIDVPPFHYPLRIMKYIQRPVLCGKCSRWNHNRRQCNNAPRCRYCAGNHESRICAQHIANENEIIPLCCNCGATHKASDMRCRFRPRPENQSWNASSETANNGNQDLAADPPRPGPSQPHTHSPPTSPCNPWERQKKEETNLHTAIIPEVTVGEEENIPVINDLVKRIDTLEKTCDNILKLVQHQKESEQLTSFEAEEEVPTEGIRDEINDISCQNVHLKTPWPRGMPAKTIKEALTKVYKRNEPPNEITKLAVRVYRLNIILQGKIKSLVEDQHIEIEQDGTSQDS